MPGFERWSTRRCRTQRLTRLKTPSCRSTHWCTGTPTPDSSPPTSTSRLFKAAHVPPLNPSATPPLPTSSSSYSDCAGLMPDVCRFCSHTPPGPEFSKSSRLFESRLLFSLIHKRFKSLPRLSYLCFLFPFINIHYQCQNLFSCVLYLFSDFTFNPNFCSCSFLFPLRPSQTSFQSRLCHLDYMWGC